MDEHSFRHAVWSALSDLARQVDEIDSDAFDARLTDGVFQVDFEDGSVFVLSQQVPARELWLSANARAWHFRPDDGWRERDSGEKLELLLSELFTRKFGMPIRIASPPST